MPMMTEMSNKTEPWKCIKHCMEYVQVAILYIFLKSAKGKKINNNLQMTKRKRAEVVLFVGKIN